MNPYIYRIANLRVVDGDTVDCDIDLGFDQWMHGQRIRMHGIDAPETRTRDLEEKQRGLEAKQWLIDTLSGDPSRLRLVSDEFEPRGKFGRILGAILVLIDGSDPLNVNDEMVRLELARPYYGGKR